ncbi:MAG: hypothetical protein D6707_12055 [Bacteroidetes bacterium]|nr:MAG: hypothetical protein D6707_12055 [Bacteroidota bacterium]
MSPFYRFAAPSAKAGGQNFGFLCPIILIKQWLFHPTVFAKIHRTRKITIIILDERKWTRKSSTKFNVLQETLTLH